MFVIDVELERVVSLARKPRNSALAAIRNASLVDDLSYSQAVGQFLVGSGIQGLLFKEHGRSWCQPTGFFGELRSRPTQGSEAQ